MISFSMAGSAAFCGTASAATGARKKCQKMFVSAFRTEVDNNSAEFVTRPLIGIIHFNLLSVSVIFDFSPFQTRKYKIFDVISS